MIDVRDTDAYMAISHFYGDRKAERSGVPLINHINEGLVILDELHATEETKRAWCLHPLFQANEELMTVGLQFARECFDAHAVMLTMEYRQWANAWLSDKVREIVMVRSDDTELPTGQIEKIGTPTPGPLKEVKQMLIADKVQNYKDFLTYHAATHERSKELDLYFRLWLHHLDVTEADFKALCELIDQSK
jgi:hypothetical protein